MPSLMFHMSEQLDKIVQMQTNLIELCKIMNKDIGELEKRMGRLEEAKSTPRKECQECKQGCSTFYTDKDGKMICSSCYWR